MEKYSNPLKIKGFKEPQKPLFISADLSYIEDFFEEASLNKLLHNFCSKANLSKETIYNILGLEELLNLSECITPNLKKVMEGKSVREAFLGE